MICNFVYFTVMADECTDVSNKEQFTIILRWIDSDLNDHEDFIGLYNVDSIDSGTLSDAIKDVLIHMNLNLSRCRGQCYDGASNMSGCRSGVAARLLADEKHVIYTHCYAHALNLAVGDTLKQSQICCEALEVAFEIAKLIKFSPKRKFNAAFDRIKAEDDNDLISRVAIRSFCPTRWTVRDASIASILESYNILKRLWDECLEESLVPEVKGRIIGMKAQMSNFKLLFGLHLSERMITDNLSKTLQTSSMSAAEAQAIAAKTVETLKRMRSDEMFASFWKHVECLQSRTNINEPTLPRKWKAQHNMKQVGKALMLIP